MRIKRAPDRVHVVHPPQEDHPAMTSRDGDIIRMLAKISDKLKRSETERQALLEEIREYRNSLTDLEDKTDQVEKFYLGLEHKFKTRDKLESEMSQRQARFEKVLKQTEDKLVKAVAGQALLDQRLQDDTDWRTAVETRIDEAASEQTRMDRRLEQISQDKSRTLRKVERLEEIVVETQDSLKAKAMVLLTDQSTAAQTGRKQVSAWTPGEINEQDNALAQALPWYRQSVRMQSVGMGAMIVAALLLGWTINQVQQPDIPSIAVLENGGLAKLNLDESRWEPVVQNNEIVPSETLTELNTIEEQKLENRLASVEEEVLPDNTANADPIQLLPEESLAEQTQQAFDYTNDEQLAAAFDADPDQLAAELNNIEPAIAVEPESVQPVVEAIEKPVEKSVGQNISVSLTPKMDNFDSVAFVQNASLRDAITNERTNAALSERFQPDASLPDVIKPIEAKAFDGIAEAQHDLAAIYTAGHGGVEQNFEKAAFWFREASDNGIGNARYNLGVLYHQGLGVERDLDRALYWYREAARLNHPEAQYNLGIAHIEGIGTEYNPQLASAFFERAANNGIMEAAYNLGLVYENGLLGQAKPDEALLWYKIAADQGSPDAKAAIEQLAASLQIGMEDVDKLVERMQAINEATIGRRAGPLPEKQSKSSSRQVNQNQAVLAQIQENLMALGLYPGPADGIHGPKTADAITSYQQRAGLPVTGKPTQDLLVHLLSGGNTQAQSDDQVSSFNQ